MDITIILLIPTLLFLLGLSALFSGSEIALMACKRHVIQSQARQGSRRARLVLELLEQPERLLSTILVGNNLVNTASVSIATYFMLSITHGHGEVVAYTTLGMTLILLIFGEITPKSFAAYRANEWALFFSPTLYVVLITIYHPIRFLSLTARLFLRLLGVQPRNHEPRLTLEELRSLLMILRSNPERLDEELRMMVRISDLPMHTAGEIMIHRDRLLMLEKELSMEEVEKIILASGYSRFPVYEETTDNILGVLYVKDYFRWKSRTEPNLRTWRSLLTILRQPIKILVGTRIDQVLKSMREKRVHIALVYDEYGGFEGIVTLEDILEEIVGEIEDEYDPARIHPMEPVGPDTWEVHGQIPLKDLNPHLPEPLPESSDYTTLAGFLIKQRDAIPEAMEILEYGPYRFSVLAKQGHKLQKIRIHFQRPVGE